MEYKEFTKYYDKFYQNKDYVKEVYANYDINTKGCCTSKNLQFVISKNKLF